jgi:hypothetical protein
VSISCSQEVLDLYRSLIVSVVTPGGTEHSSRMVMHR